MSKPVGVRHRRLLLSPVVAILLATRLVAPAAGAASSAGSPAGTARLTSG